MKDIINEVFIAVMGVMMLTAPFTEKTLGSWLLFFSGIWFLSALFVTYTVGDRFDAKFRDTFLNDKDIDAKLPLAMMSPKFLVGLRLVRATGYARNIVFPKNSIKNPIQYSWFHGYDFRRNARAIDFIAAYLFVSSLVICIAFGLTLVVLQLFGILS